MTALDKMSLTASSTYKLTHSGLRMPCIALGVYQSSELLQQRTIGITIILIIIVYSCGPPKRVLGSSARIQVCQLLLNVFLG